MFIDINKVNDAHELLKQCLMSHPNNLNLRALYAHFLMQNVRTNDYKTFRDFIFNTFKHDSHDVYNLCATAWLHYFQARESRDITPKGVEERKRNFGRAAEFYEKALAFDPLCAYAAQGLAIIVAEDALGTLYGALGGVTPDEGAKRDRNMREALDTFAKVRESIDDGSVYQNMGHCYYARDEFDKAIESVGPFFWFYEVLVG
jgi:RNA polymerase-associated protein CTR9